MKPTIKPDGDGWFAVYDDRGALRSIERTKADAKRELMALCDRLRREVEEKAAKATPFGLEPDDLMQPFCACGRARSRCDRSRRGCAEAAR